jgi:hydrogenase expression/formation protein HypE
LISVDSTIADQVLQKIRATKNGKDAVIIGEVKKDNPKKVLLHTMIGGTRFVDKPLGEPIPRIC